jgi:hypothetical protein
LWRRAVQSAYFSDHCVLFVNWDEVLLFGAQTPSIQSQKHRRLQSKSIPSRIQYIDSLHHFCTEHCLVERLKQLHENPCSILAESIDKDLTQGMLSSEKKCRSHGEDPWSLVLQQARLRIDIFRHALSMVRLGLENHHKIQRLLAGYAIPVDIPDSLVDIQIALRMAQSSLRQVQKQATEERKELLQRRISEAHKQNDKKDGSLQ